MSSPTPAATSAEPPTAGVPDPARQRRRRAQVTVVLLATLTAIALIVTDPFSGGGPVGGVRDNQYPTSLQRIVRESLTSQTQVSATLGYGGDLTVRLPSGNAPSAVMQAQQTVSGDHGALASSRSTLSSDSSALSQAQATVSADQQQESVECAGANAAQTPTGEGGATSGASGGRCASDVQTVASAQQAVTTDMAKVSADQSQLSSAQHSLSAAQATLATALAQATPYGQHSTFTRVPSAGAVIDRGEALCRIDGRPVLLLYGTSVATREFAAGMSPGADVGELNGNLDALGFGHGLHGDAFTAATAAAIRRLQLAHGETPTGRLLLGSVVFERRPVRVTALAPSVSVGSPVAAGPLLSATWITRQVSIPLDASFEGQVKVGDPVTITLPDNQTTPGRISYVSPVASSGQNGATIQADAVPTDPAATGDLDQAPVNVSITTGSAHNVLVVPVDALLSLSSDAYAVEEVGTNGVHHLVSVTTGLFDDADGLVQVSGSGLAAGQRVVVPDQ